MLGGGAERVMLTLANALAERGHRVDLVLSRAEGPYLRDISKRVRLIDLGAGRALHSIWPLVRYLRRERPDAMLSALNYANVIAIIAWKFARVSTRLVVSERNSLEQRPKDAINTIVRLLMRWLYPSADKVICVSNGIEAQMQRLFGLPKSKMRTIYNPVDIEMIKERSEKTLDHPWFSNKTVPVILAAGRLELQKDYPTLLKAFAQLRDKRDARLVVLGQGTEKARLKKLTEELKIEKYVDFVGFQANPFAWMARCDLFVMSSAWEGFPSVLVQAMACGAKVVSTNCRTGPDEILENGRWGGLVPVGDALSLCKAMNAALDQTRAPNVKQRVNSFNLDAITTQYETALLN